MPDDVRWVVPMSAGTYHIFSTPTETASYHDLTYNPTLTSWFRYELAWYVRLLREGYSLGHKYAKVQVRTDTTRVDMDTTKMKRNHAQARSRRALSSNQFIYSKLSIYLYSQAVCLSVCCPFVGSEFRM